MNTHLYDPETVMSYFDGELSSTEAADLAAHLHVCPDCSKLADDFVHVSGTLAKWQVENFRAGENNPAPFSKIAGRNDKHPYRRALLWASAVGVACLLLAAIAIPNLIKSKMAANEASAVGSLRTLTTVTNVYSTEHGHLPPDLKSLEGQIDSTLASGTKAGYRFTYQPYGNRYIVKAEPIQPEKSGTRYFSTDETGTIFWNGRPLDGDVSIAEESQSAGKQVTQHQRVAMIARTVELSIVVRDFASARASLDTLLIRHRGYAAQLSISGDPSSRGSLRASLRIPVSEVDSALSELKALGHVEQESQSGEEVTMQHADLAARISNALETEARLKDILRTRTGKVADVLEVEQQISQTRGQIEQMEAELKTLEARVDFASVSLTLSTEFKDRVGELSPSARTRIRNASVSGYRDLRETVIGLIVWILESGPGIVLWAALLASPSFWIWRRWRAVQSRVQAAV